MGKVYLVGAGPGDPGLITVKGMELLKKADLIVYDSLIPSELLDLAPKDCHKIHVGKRAGQHSAAQEEINHLLVQSAGNYDRIVRLKGGDPFVFGRGGEEVLALQEEGIPFEVVSGITSAVAVPAHQGIPVTHRREVRSFHVITGHLAEGKQDFRIYAHLDGSLIFLMGLSSLPKIVSDLLEGGMSPETPAAVISNAFRREERCVRAPLQKIACEAAELSSPAVIVVGSNAAYEFRDSRDFPDPESRIAVVGTSSFYNRLRQSMGSDADHLFHSVEIELTPVPEGMAALEQSLSGIEACSWIVLNSQNAVRFLFDAADRIDFDRRRFANIRFGVIGPGTAAALKEYGYHADYLPEVYTSEALAEGLIRESGNGRMLVIRAAEGNPAMEQLFSESGITYDRIELYRSEGKWLEDFRSLQEKGILVLASASGVRCFQRMIEKEAYSLPDSWRIVCIGHATAEAVRAWGREPFMVAEEHSAAGLADLLENCISKRGC